MILRVIISVLTLMPVNMAYAQQYVVSTYPGGGALPAQAPGVNLSIGWNSKVLSVDTAGSVYFTSWNSIFKLAPSGTVTRIAGNRMDEYSGDGRPATQAAVSNPFRIAVDSSGNIYFSGPDNNVVRVPRPAAAAMLTASRPPVVAVNPAVSTGLTQTFTFEFTPTADVQELDLLDILINDRLDDAGACYIVYTKIPPLLFLGSVVPAISLTTGPGGTVSNGRCSITGGPSSISFSGDTFRLTVDVTFSPSFAGPKTIYMAARGPCLSEDGPCENSGWQTVGVHVVPSPVTSYPAPVSMTPATGTALNQTITFTYQDQTSAANLQTVWALINTAIDGRSACYVAYYRPGNQLYLFPDNGDGTQATNIVLAGNNTISNSQCSISAQGANVQTSGNTLSLTLPISFKPAFAGSKGVWLAAQTLTGEVSSWQAFGVELLPPQ